MTNVAEILQDVGIKLSSTAPGKYNTTCPQCSPQRQPHHRRIKCLGILIDERGVCWNCNHCGWKGPEKKKRKGNSHAGNIVAIYDYRDANGVLRFQKVRWPKGHKPPYSLRRPNGAGDWSWNVEGIDTTLLYRLPEAIEAIAHGGRIATVEGEKDADNLWAIGVPATCNAHGAHDPLRNQKPKWRREHSEQLRGAPIVVFNDNDVPGYAHADVTCSTSRGIASRVQRLDLKAHWPEIPKGGDVSDWLGAGHTREELDALMQAAPDYEPGEPPPPGPPPPGPPPPGPPPPGPLDEPVSLQDFFAYMPQHSYIFAPTRELWPAASVNARIPPVPGPNDTPIPPTRWLDINAAVEQMTWAPGEPMLIRDRLIADGGWFERPGAAVFNLYRPAVIVPKAGDVTPWLSLIEKAFPDEAKHIMLWLAQRVQRPHEKINHALVLGGKPGIGKDTILEPVKQAVGPWNFADVSPSQVLGRFNGFSRSVILRVNEARDLGDFDRYKFHDHMKALIAAPPDVLRVDEKNLREYYALNLCGVVITSNHKTDGIYLPADDRRHSVAWSNSGPEDFPEDYWRKLYGYYANGGNEAVAAYLQDLDLSGFDPKAPPTKTSAFWEIVNANRAPEDTELADVLDALGKANPHSKDEIIRPDVVTLDQVTSMAGTLQPAFAEWLRDRKNRRSIPHRFEDCGYVVVRNPNDTEGRWKIRGTRHTIYAKAALSVRDRVATAEKYVAGKR
jgi:Family of unknown function (DUF5906)